MSRAGLVGVSRRKFITTTVKGGNRQAPDLVERNFTAPAPDRLWVPDITYIPTWAGFLYLAVVLDACSRRIVGWSMATTLAAELVLDALNMALAGRRPRGVIHHSDQGSQGGFKWSSQHQVCCPTGATGQAPLRVFSTPVSFGAGH
jgi:putative transposase